MELKTVCLLSGSCCCGFYSFFNFRQKIEFFLEGIFCYFFLLAIRAWGPDFFINFHQKCHVETKKKTDNQTAALESSYPACHKTTSRAQRRKPYAFVQFVVSCFVAYVTTSTVLRNVQFHFGLLYGGLLYK